MSKGVPYRHMLLDSWWYFKGELGGVKNWTARPDIFPNGLQALHANLTVPWLAHNRWWAPETDYARQNGGQYDFVIQNNFGLPTEQRFWDDLIRNSSVWGLRVYEQDWLFTVWDNHPAVRENITLGRNWLLQMGAGARKAGVNIQYCMPYPRHLLQSVEIPNVVQVRASTDNVPGNDDNWSARARGDYRIASVRHILNAPLVGLHHITSLLFADSLAAVIVFVLTVRLSGASASRICSPMHWEWRRSKTRSGPPASNPATPGTAPNPHPRCKPPSPHCPPAPSTPVTRSATPTCRCWPCRTAAMDCC